MVVDQVARCVTNSGGMGKIDRLVYDLYGLTESEIAAVERRVGG